MRTFIKILFWTLPVVEAIGFAQSYGIQTVAGTTVVKDGIQASSAFLREPFAVVADAAGNVYIADRSDNRVRKVGRDGVITTVAGTGIPGRLNDGGPALQAQLNTPFLLAINKNSLYIAEYISSLVRKLDLTTGILTTVAGNGRIRPVAGDGPKALQSAMDPEGIAIDSKGNLLISDGLNHRLRKVAPDGTISTVAGNGVCGDSGDNTSANAAQVCEPTGMGIDSADNIYFIDYGNSRVRKIDGKTGLIAPYLGDGFPISDNDGYPPRSTSVYYPDALAVDAAGNVYASENSRVRYVAAAGGTVRTVAGNGTLGFSGDKGSAVAAKLAFPAGVFAFASGDMLLADTGNFRVRRVTGGTIDTIAGIAITDGAAALTSLFNGPNGIAEDSSGNIYIADTYNSRIRKVTSATGAVSTIAGTGTAGSLDGRINSPDDVAVDSKGLVYFSDTSNNRVFQIQPDGTAKIYAGTGTAGYTGDNSFAKNARLSKPRALVFDKSDTLYISDSSNYRIRKVTSDGLIQLVAGNGNPLFSGDGGNAKSAGMNPRGLAVEADGTLYFADYSNSRVRRVDASSGIVTTVAGSGTFGNAGDSGKATGAYVSTPYGLAIDANRNLLITDQFASVIRWVNLTTGLIATVAGTGKVDFSGESGAATQTNFDPSKMFVEKSGTILVSDPLNDRIRRLTPLIARTLSINSGDKQSASPGASLAISVKVRDSNGYPIQGQTVSFSVTSGTATLTNTTAATGVDGIAVSQVTLGSAGSVTVRADSVGLTSVTFNLQITVRMISTIMAVVGAPQSVPPVRTVSKNGTAFIWLADPNSHILAMAIEASPPYPTVLNQTCVTVGGVKAPMFTAGASRIGIIVPDVPAGPADVVVTETCGTGNDAATAPFSVTVVPASPEFYYAQRSVDGKSYVTAVASGSAVGTPDVPAQPGDAVSISAAGLSDTNPPQPIGDVPADVAPVTGTFIVMLGGNPLPPEAVTFVGLAPGALPGVYRVDLTIPADAALGDQPITIQIGDAVSPVGWLTIGVPATQSSRESRKMEKDETRQLQRKRNQH